jgi:hypothetical protein
MKIQRRGVISKPIVKESKGNQTITNLTMLLATLTLVNNLYTIANKAIQTQQSQQIITIPSKPAETAITQPLDSNSNKDAGSGQALPQLTLPSPSPIAPPMYKVLEYANGPTGKILVNGEYISVSCGYNTIAGMKNPVTVRHCVQTMPEEPDYLNTLDSPVDMITKEAVTLSTPKLGPATIFGYHFGRIVETSITITKVTPNYCGARFVTTDNIQKTWVQGGDSGSVAYQKDKQGNKIAIGVFSRGDNSLMSHEEGKPAYTKGDIVYKDCKLNTNEPEEN